jgi:hypothetical protein
VVELLQQMKENTRVFKDSTFNGRNTSSSY